MADRFRDRGGELWEIVEGSFDDTPLHVRRVTETAPFDEGVYDVLHYDPAGPVQIGIALMHPSVAFFTNRIAESTAGALALRAREVEAASEADALDLDRLSDRLAFAEHDTKPATLRALRAEVITAHEQAHGLDGGVLVDQATIDVFAAVSAATTSGNMSGRPSLADLLDAPQVIAAQVEASMADPTSPIAPATLPGAGTDARKALLVALGTATTLEEQQAAWLEYGSAALGGAPPDPNDPETIIRRYDS